MQKKWNICPLESTYQTSRYQLNFSGARLTLKFDRQTTPGSFIPSPTTILILIKSNEFHRGFTDPKRRAFRDFGHLYYFGSQQQVSKKILLCPY